MIRCAPKRLFSWDYRLEAESHRALLEFRWSKEDGAITIDGVRSVIAEDGGLGGRWTMESGGVEVATARWATKKWPRFQVQSSIGPLSIVALSRSGRRVEFVRHNKVLATVAPAHLLSRRARIDVVDPVLEFPLASFLFWLVVVSWRRGVVDL